MMNKKEKFDISKLSEKDKAWMYLLLMLALGDSKITKEFEKEDHKESE